PGLPPRPSASRPASSPSPKPGARPAASPSRMRSSGCGSAPAASSTPRWWPRSPGSSRHMPAGIRRGRMAWPPSSGPGHAVAWALRAVAVAALAALTLHLADGAIGPALPGTAWLSSDTLHTVLKALGAALCLWRARLTPLDRAAWLLVGAGIGAYTIGETIWYAAY